MEEIAPNRNRPIYVLGHLVAVNDTMLPILGKGERLYPELEPIFLRTPDKAVEAIPSIEDLKEKWEKINTTLSDIFNKMEPQEWLDRHTRVSAEDFAKEPHRNKLNILLSRTNHTAYHAGQLALVKDKELVG